jgi:hypothetical protein
MMPGNSLILRQNKMSHQCTYPRPSVFNENVAIPVTFYSSKCLLPQLESTGYCISLLCTSKEWLVNTIMTNNYLIIFCSSHTFYFNMQRNITKTVIFCDVMPCCETDYQHFRGTYRFHLHGYNSVILLKAD